VVLPAPFGPATATITGRLSNRAKSSSGCLELSIDKPSDGARSIRLDANQHSPLARCRFVVRERLTRKMFRKRRRLPGIHGLQAFRQRPNGPERTSSAWAPWRTGSIGVQVGPVLDLSGDRPLHNSRRKRASRTSSSESFTGDSCSNGSKMLPTRQAALSQLLQDQLAACVRLVATKTQPAPTVRSTCHLAEVLDRAADVLERLGPARPSLQ